MRKKQHQLYCNDYDTNLKNGVAVIPPNPNQPIRMDPIHVQLCVGRQLRSIVGIFPHQFKPIGLGKDFPELQLLTCDIVHVWPTMVMLSLLTSDITFNA